MDYCLMTNENESGQQRKLVKGFGGCCLFSFIALPYVGIAILFALYAVDRHHMTKNKYYTETDIIELSATSSNSGFSSNSYKSTGTIVSLTQSGLIQEGSGTTIFQDLTEIYASCPKYLDIDAVYDSSFLLFYGHKSPSSCSLSVITMDPDTLETTTTVNITSPYFLVEIVTLEQSTGIFVGIAQGYSSVNNTGVILAGRVAADGKSIKLGKAAEFVTSYSLDPRITRLSSNSFAISYYSYSSPATLRTKYGIVDPTTLQTTLSTGMVYASDSSYDKNHAIIGLSSYNYLLLSYSTKAGTIKGSGPLVVTPATLVANATATGGYSIILGTTSTLTSSALTYYFKATKLDEYTVAVAYIDANAGYTLTCVLVHLDRTTTGSSLFTTFGSSLALTSGRALKTSTTGVLMDLDVQTLAATNATSAMSFVVLFSDVSNGGVVTTTVIEVTDSNDLVRASPDFPLSGANTNYEVYFTWGALSATNSGQMALVYSRTNYDCKTFATTGFSLLETKPKPLGIIISSSTGSSTITVATSGVVSGFSGLTPGICYYADTQGNLVDSGLYYGQAPLVGDELEYVSNAAGNKLLSADSFVGVAVSSDSISLTK